MHKFFITCIFCLMNSMMAEAATVNVVPSTNSVANSNTFSVLVSGVGLPETGGATLGLTFDASIIHVTGMSLAQGSPFDTLIPTSFDNVGGQVERISLLAPVTGTLPSGGFNAFSIDFLAVGSGYSAISLIDDVADGVINAGDYKGWVGADFSLIMDITYNQGGGNGGAIACSRLAFCQCSGSARFWG